MGCALPADRTSAQGCCRLQSWSPLSPRSHSHHLTLHLLPEGSTLRRCRPWPGLGLLGAPQVGTVTELASLHSRMLAAKPAGPLARVSPFRLSLRMLGLQMCASPSGFFFLNRCWDSISGGQDYAPRTFTC